MNHSASSSVSALRSKGMFLRQIKKNHPRAIQKTIETTPPLQTMKQIYDCFYEYSKNLLSQKPFNQNIELEKRGVSASELRVVLPISLDIQARLKMADAYGHVRLGRLLEALDIVAPASCYMLNRKDLTSNFFDIGSLPRMFLTSRIHQVSLENAYRISPYHDIYLNGKVTWTGPTETEATVSVQQNGNAVLSAKFVFSSLDGNKTDKKLPVNQLLPTTSYEAELFHRRHVVNTKIPDAPENKALEKPCLAENEVSMSSTLIETRVIAHPEHENPYGYVFSGFLVRQAIEIGEMCAKQFTKTQVKAISLDDAKFLKIIEIGSILKLNAYVCNVNTKQVQIDITAESLNEMTNKFEKSNQFMFTFEIEAENDNEDTETEFNLPQVVPQNMREFVAQWQAQNIKRN